MKNVLIVLMALSSASAFADKYECHLASLETQSSGETVLDDVSLEVAPGGTAYGKGSISGTDMIVSIQNQPGTKNMVVVGGILKGEAGTGTFSLGTEVARGASSAKAFYGQPNGSGLILDCKKK